MTSAQDQSTSSATLSRRRRSQAERRDESERLLVEATLKVVAERGVSAATFEEIGKEAGLSRGLVTQRFGSKHGLIEAVIAYLHNKREAIMQAERIDQMPVFDAVARYIDAHLRAQAEEQDGPAYFMLLAATVADATALRELFAASHERVRVRLRALLKHGQTRGEIRRDINPDACALTIGSLLLGASIQLLVNPSTNLKPIRAEAISILRRALVAP
ncbi:MAG: TetR family transcriptional regulator [Alphaproteobacteria bacterium]|nr:TetR family transcriptional regulator [Alphaproteobacteria bacterium]